MKSILGNLRRTIQENNLIKDGDRVAVGVSGGKDSTAMLYALKKFQRFSPIKYELEAISVSLGFEGHDFKPLKDFCKEIGVNYTIKETQIKEVVFDIRKEKNPCSLCANLRRGALHEAMEELNCNVVALGHHNDDAIETFFMNLFYTGRIQTFQIDTYLDRRNINVIRPFINVSEYQIIDLVEAENLPIIKSPCPVDKETKRETMKDFTKELYKEFPLAKTNILRSFQNKDQMKLWF